MSLSEAPAAASDPPHRIWASIDGAEAGIWDITNTGTIGALDRVFRSGRMEASVKTEAMTEILAGAAASGNLVPAELVVGDAVYVLDESTGNIEIALFGGSSFTMPNGSTSFTRISIPGGAR